MLTTMDSYIYTKTIMPNVHNTEKTELSNSASENEANGLMAVSGLCLWL